jgi:hypothetical protein
MKGRRGVRSDASAPPAATLPGLAERKLLEFPRPRSFDRGTRVPVAHWRATAASSSLPSQPSLRGVPVAPAKFALERTPRRISLQFDKNSRTGSEARSSGPAVHARLEDWRSRYEHAAPKQYFSGRSSRWSLTECMARLKMRRRARSVKTRDPSGRRWLRHPDSSGAVGPHRRADNHGRHARAESGRQRDAGSSRCAGPRVESFAAITELCGSV